MSNVPAAVERAAAGMRRAEREAARRSRRLAAPVLLISLFGLTISGCAAPYARYEEYHEVAPVSSPAIPPSTQVYFYSASDRTLAQEDRDRYECYLWAVRQTGFDPAQIRPVASQSVAVMPMPPPGHDTAVGAATGAVIGAVVSRPREGGAGALIGAVAGAIVGAASDAARRQQADRLQESYDRVDAQERARVERQARDYRRAMSACLEGGGYTVR